MHYLYALPSNLLLFAQQCMCSAGIAKDLLRLVGSELECRADKTLELKNQCFDRGRQIIGGTLVRHAMPAVRVRRGVRAAN